MRTLSHSPADILRYVLIDLSQGTVPPIPPALAGAWPIYASSEPFSPDNLITVYDTTGKGAGRSMIDGEIQGFYGIQVRIRAKDHKTGWQKADALQTFMAQGIYQRGITIDNVAYLLHAVSNIGDVMVLGKDPDSKRSLFTINAILTVRQITE